MTNYDVLLITIDSLRRDFLGAYRDRPRVTEYDVATPNLDRFAERAAVFENHYAGSLPCMPQRREFMCGIQEFLWRPWGPVEPYDSTVPALAKQAGATTQLITDHYHYFEHGSNGYYEDYHGFEFIRGHETDQWQTSPRYPDERLLNQINRGGLDPTDPGPDSQAIYARNVADFDVLDERDFFAPKVFARTAEWLGDNIGDWDQWFCYVDSFDVHEPFHCPEPYASMYTDEDPTDPEMIVWPEYDTLDGQRMTDRQLEFVISQFAGKTTMVDRWFGRVVDRLDREEAWDDTIVIVTTDHGEMLGEHGYMMKNYMPVYDAIANTPLLIHHPEREVERVDAVTSAVDVYSTLLDGIGTEVPQNTHGFSLLPLVHGDRGDHREYALYGYFGQDACITDGRYTYFHPGVEDPVNIYSTMHMRHKNGDAAVASLPYTDDNVWRYPAGTGSRQAEEPMLFDTEEDPGQEINLADARPEELERMRGLLREALHDVEAPPEQLARFGFD